MGRGASQGGGEAPGQRGGFTPFDLSLAPFFETPTVRGLAQRVERLVVERRRMSWSPNRSRSRGFRNTR